MVNFREELVNSIFSLGKTIGAGISYKIWISLIGIYLEIFFILTKGVNNFNNDNYRREEAARFSIFFVTKGKKRPQIPNFLYLFSILLVLIFIFMSNNSNINTIIAMLPIVTPYSLRLYLTKPIAYKLIKRFSQGNGKKIAETFSAAIKKETSENIITSEAITGLGNKIAAPTTQQQKASKTAQTYAQEKQFKKNTSEVKKFKKASTSGNSENFVSEYQHSKTDNKPDISDLINNMKNLCEKNPNADLCTNIANNNENTLKKLKSISEQIKKSGLSVYDIKEIISTLENIEKQLISDLITSENLKALKNGKNFFPTKDMLEYNRLLTSDYLKQETFLDLLSHDLDINNCFSLEQCKNKLEALRSLNKYLDTSIENTILLEIGRRVGVFEYDDLSYLKFLKDNTSSDLGNPVISKDINAIIGENNIIIGKVQKNFILSNLSKTNIYFGVISENFYKEKNTFLLAGNDMHCLFAIEDPDDFSSLLILGYFTSSKNSKNIFLSEYNYDNQKKDQMIHISNTLFKISKDNFDKKDQIYIYLQEDNRFDGFLNKLKNYFCKAELLDKKDISIITNENFLDFIKIKLKEKIELLQKRYNNLERDYNSNPEQSHKKNQQREKEYNRKLISDKINITAEAKEVISSYLNVFDMILEKYPTLIDDSVLYDNFKDE